MGSVAHGRNRKDATEHVLLNDFVILSVAKNLMGCFATLNMTVKLRRK